MKNCYAFLLALFVVSISHSQIVDIPDPAFKAELLPSVDTNGDGEIEVSEAEAKTSLGLDLCILDNTIGIQAFTNLINLSFGSYCDITNPVDLSGMTSIKKIHFHKCSIPSVNVAGMTGLVQLSWGYVGTPLVNLNQAVNVKTMSYSYGGPDSLDLTGLVNLTDFYADQADIQYMTLDGLTSMVNFTLVGNTTMPDGIDVSDMVNLKKLHLTNCYLTSLDLHNNVLLEELALGRNNLTSLDVSMLPNLQRFSCSNNLLTSLDVSMLANLTNLGCDGNSLTSLDVANLPNLVGFNCSENNLTALDISNNTNLQSFNCSFNQLTNLDFSGMSQLKAVDVSNNLFTTLDFSGLTLPFDSLSDIHKVSNNPNLVSVSVKNGKYDLLEFDGCPNLVYICADDIDMSSYFGTGFPALLVFHGITNVQVNTYCSFVPGGNYNTIAGRISMDTDNNGCDASDVGFADAKLTLSGTDANGITYSTEDGMYNFYTQAGEFTVTPQFENPYFTISPASVTVNFADNNNNVETENFCLTPNGLHNDLEITLIPLNAARPGFDTSYQIIYRNKGNQPLSGSIDLAFEDDVLDLVSANPGTSSQSANQLHWDYSNLPPFESRIIDFTLNVNSPMETPAVNFGNTLEFNISISPSEDDETPTDNNATLVQTVVGSFDPNDKICLEGNTMAPEMVGNYLHYVIRFQNSGTYQAENVVVKDVIDTEKFDISTLQLTDVSHPQVTRIDGNKVEFIFENINLPAEENDEPGSHGFVAFKIKTKPHLVLGDSVENTADIFFDFNFPIVTNTTSTTVSTLGIGEVEDISVLIAPNPVRNTLTISAKDEITSIQVFDIQGRLLQTKLENDTMSSIDFSGKAKGIYFVKVHTEKGIKTQKIIKE